MSSQRFDFWVRFAGVAATCVTLLSAFAAFGMMAINGGALSVLGLTD